MLRRLAAALKNFLLPHKFAHLKVRAGLARGSILPLNVRYQLYVALGLYERDIAPWVKPWVKRDCVFYDVGAGQGYYAVAFARRMRRGKVYAFEFVPWVLELLHQVERANNLNPDRFQIVKAEVGMTSQVDPPRLSLDDFVRREGARPPDLIKIDVEGGELLVLKGAHQVLTTHRPAILLEFHSEALRDECTGLLHAVGYTTRQEEPRKWPRDSRPVELNGWLLGEYHGRVANP